MIIKPKAGRQPMPPMRLKNGFYVSLKSQGIAIMMHNKTEEDMQATAERYRGISGKVVVIMGERLNNEWVSNRKPLRSKSTTPKKEE